MEFEQLQSEGLATVPVSLLRANPVSLRTVNKEGDGYRELVDSISNEGLLNPIVVRLKDEKNEKGEVIGQYYEVSDGLHRFSAVKDAGLETIKVNIITATDAKVLKLQTIANAVRIETKPCEYAAQLRRIMDTEDTMTERDLAETLHKSIQWIQNILGLQKIVNPAVRKMIDEGKISVNNAYALSKMLPADQDAFLEDAQTMPTAQFQEKCAARMKEVRSAKNDGKNAPELEFKPVPFLRSISVLKAELESLQTLSTQISPNMDPVDAVKMALAWALNIDTASVEAQRIQFEEKMRSRKEDAEKREKARIEKEAAKQASKAKLANDRAALTRQLSDGSITREEYTAKVAELEEAAKPAKKTAPAE